MAGIPQNFQAISNVLANYEFLDIASGTGYINFYAGTTVDLNLLSNNTFYSEDIYIQSSTWNWDAPAQMVFDTDFDIVLNRPMDLKGKGIVNIPHYYNSGGNTSTYYVRVVLRKWDGSTETDIVSNDSDTYAIGGVTGYRMNALDLDIPLTHFKIGETIRLNVQVWGYKAGVGVTGYIKIGCDPKSRTSSWEATGAVVSQLVFQCPVRLNL